MTEEAEMCKQCGADAEYLTRIPSIISDIKTNIKERKVGSIVNNHIEEAKETIKQEKHKLKGELDI